MWSVSVRLLASGIWRLAYPILQFTISYEKWAPSSGLLLLCLPPWMIHRMVCVWLSNASCPPPSDGGGLEVTKTNAERKIENRIFCLYWPLLLLYNIVPTQRKNTSLVHWRVPIYLCIVCTRYDTGMCNTYNIHTGAFHTPRPVAKRGGSHFSNNLRM